MSNKITFKYEWESKGEYSSNIPEKTVTHSTDAEALSDVLEAFEYFLKGSGFHFNGNIGIVDLEGDTSE